MNTLTRIASALERIAEALETNHDNAVAKRLSADPIHRAFIGTLAHHRTQLRGRMTMQEICEVTGMIITKHNRVAIGHALTAFGAQKGKSGSTRYYVFD
jgi:hypothetical protein